MDRKPVLLVSAPRSVGIVAAISFIQNTAEHHRPAAAHVARFVGSYSGSSSSLAGLRERQAIYRRWPPLLDRFAMRAEGPFHTSDKDPFFVSAERTAP